MSHFEVLFAYNTLVVLAGTMLLGIAAGITGTFLMLRRRSLAGDVIGHAALPGVAIAFLIHAAIAPDAGKSLPLMLLGGGIASACGMLAALWLRNVARLPEDAVMAIVLSTFFGIGVVLLSIIQASPTGAQAGIKDFIFGQAAAIRISDVALLATITAGTIVICHSLVKEWTLMCFDQGLAGVLGYPVRTLDFLLMALVVAVCVAGMQAVGLLLIVALLIIPPTSARFWSDSIGPNIWLSAIFGAISATTGGIASALVPKLSTGAIIVLAAAMFMLFSMLFGSRHGLLLRWHARRMMKRASQNTPPA